jgi:hypothetical protein
MKKEDLVENNLTMPDIIKEFNTYDTNEQKAKYLREMGQLRLPHAVKWENLAQCWEGSKPWPKLDGKDEDIMKDYVEKPKKEEEVIQGTEDDRLTVQEKDAIL